MKIEVNYIESGEVLQRGGNTFFTSEGLDLIYTS